MTDMPSAEVENESARGPIEFREATVADVNFSQRIVTVVAVPYEKRAMVMYRGDIWDEIFERSAFEGLEAAPHRVRANRDHDKGKTVGKCLRFDPKSAEGLVTEVRMAKTPRGDETLALCDDDCLSASAGFAVPPGGHVLQRQSMTRRIRKAFMDHLAFVESPAYADAKVLSVRADDLAGDPLPPLKAPNLDQTIAEMSDILEWSRKRLNKQ